MDAVAGIQQRVCTGTGLLWSGQLHAAGVDDTNFVDHDTGNGAGSQRDRLPDVARLAPTGRPATNSSGRATNNEDARPRLHGLLAPNQQNEVELGALAAMIDKSVEGFTGQAGLAAFTRQLTVSLQSLHSFDSLALVLTKVCEPVQTAWKTHDRNREDPVNVEFFRVLTVAKENYICYAVQSSQSARHLYQGMQKLMEKIQSLVTVTHSLDGKEGAHVARGPLEPIQLLTVAEQIHIEANAMCTAYQLSEVHELRFIMEMVKMLYLLLKAAVNTGQPFVTLETWLKGRLNDPRAALPIVGALIAVTHAAGTRTAHWRRS